MLRKSLFFLIIGALCNFPLLAADETTLEELLANHHEAIGGLEKRKAIKSARYTGMIAMACGTQTEFPRVEAEGGTSYWARENGLGGESVLQAPGAPRSFFVRAADTLNASMSRQSLA